MKKHLIFSLFTVLAIVGLLSFTLFKGSPTTYGGKPFLIDNKLHNSFTCVAQVTNLHVISDVGGNITFGWSYTGSPASFNYGGYYQYGPPYTYSGNTTATQVTIPDHTSHGFGGRIGVLAICADGSSSGTTATMLWP